MNRWLSAAILILLLATAGFSAGKGPEIQLLDNKLSIDAEAIALSRLLRLLDLATGMQSKVPPELANRNISVKFSGLTLNDGVRKLFQGQPLDYVMIEGQGIIVTAASQTISTTDAAPVYAAPTPVDQPFIQDFAAPPPMPGQQQPAMIQTPFGPIANPRAGQPVMPNAPLSGPGQQQQQQQNSLFPQIQPQQQPQQMMPGQQMPVVSPGFPGGAVPANPPFSGPSTFGGAQQPQNLFGGPQPINPAPVGMPPGTQR